MPHRLPPELWELIFAHAAASSIQRRFRRWIRFGHARKTSWEAAKLHIPAPIWRLLIPFSRVRREWRLEAASWRYCTLFDFARILQEAYDMSAWGKPWQIRV